MKVLVVVLNYRTPDLAVRCLESLEAEVAEVGSMHVVVTDNDSGDDSVAIIGEAIERHSWRWCELMPLSKNGGYCFGNNAGIRPHLFKEGAPEFVMLLNPDTYIRPGAVSRLVSYLERHEDVGIAGARLEGPDGAIQNGAFRFPTPTREMLDGFRLGILSKAMRTGDIFYDLGDQPMAVDWVVGAAMMIRREVFDDIGLLDEGYFLYFDEVDFCLRARRAGWSAHYVPQSVVVHLVGRSTGISDPNKRPPRFPTYWFDSRRRFFLKHHGAVKTLAADLGFLGGYTTWRVRRVIQRKPDGDPPWFWLDFLRNSTLLKGFDLE
ncbi:MAG: glycosyltransferase family 2 protein [Myxococcota bacterium]